MLYLKQPPIPHLQGQTETLLWAFKQNKPTVKKKKYIENFPSSFGPAFDYSALVICISQCGIYSKIILHVLLIGGLDLPILTLPFTSLSKKWGYSGDQKMFTGKTEYKHNTKT